MRILLVEDEVEYRESLRDLLNLAGFACDCVGSIKSYMAWSKNQTCDVIIIDRNLPDGDGLTLVDMHRERMESKVIILSSRRSSQDRIQAFEHDIDMYLNKPVETDELISILRSLHRREFKPNQAIWTLDLVGMTISDSNQNQTQLTYRESQILRLFVDNQGEPVERNAIAAAIGLDANNYDPRKLEVILRRMRNKIQDNHNVYPFATIYGVGLLASCKLVLA